MNIKRLLLCLLITFGIGTFPALFVDFSTNLLETPPLNPPPIVFIIVWSVIYTLMGISLSLVSKKGKVPLIFYIQLVANALWTIIFFGLKLRLLAFLWILILIAAVIKMIIEFYKIDKRSAYLNILYLLWITFASYLNLMIYLLNR